MTSKEIELLLLVAVALLAGVTIYAAWLRLHLWLMDQTLRRIAVIQTQPGHEQDSAAASGGCTALLLVVFVVVLVITLFGMAG